jgi:hypothetical protein
MIGKMCEFYHMYSKAELLYTENMIKHNENDFPFTINAGMIFHFGYLFYFISVFCTLDKLRRERACS